VTVGVGRGAQLGILIKEGAALETSERVTTAAFDKTGTLTRGRPEVTDVIVSGMGEGELLGLAASLERNTRHPLGAAIVGKAREEGLKPMEASGFRTVGGKGVEGLVDGRMVLAGNPAMLKEKGIAMPGALKSKVTRLEGQGKTPVLVAVDGRVRGVIAVADELKPSSVEAVKALRGMGLKAVMITGDNERTARAIAKRAGIDDVRAGVLPGEKAEEVKRLQSAGEVVAFVGDGINDAPALAQADVGIAIGSGTDVAVESGDIVLVKSDLMDVPASIHLGRKVISRIRQNLFWAFAYNTALIPLAAGALYPLFGLTFRPEFAGFAMAMSSVTVVSLSLQLRGYTPPVKAIGGGAAEEEPLISDDDWAMSEMAPDTDEDEEDDDMAIDPICNMKVDPATAKWMSSYKGKNFFFCAEGCKKTFDADPAKYASGDAADPDVHCCGGH
jgi:Cu+-exporting ATPase